MKTDNEIRDDAITMARKVTFLETNEELQLYASTLYDAMIWGRGVDVRNNAIREMDKSVK